MKRIIEWILGLLNKDIIEEVTPLRQVSDDLLRSLIESEAVELKEYKDQAGLPTIGVGHLLTKDELSTGVIKIGGKDVKYKDGITRYQAMALLGHDLVPFCNAVEKFTKVILNQHEFDALVHFAFNVGVSAFKNSTLLKLINESKLDEAADQFEKWIYITRNGEKIKSLGLSNRRAKEKKMFKEGVY